MRAGDHVLRPHPLAHLVRQVDGQLAVRRPAGLEAVDVALLAEALVLLQVPAADAGHLDGEVEAGLVRQGVELLAAGQHGRLVAAAVQVVGHAGVLQSGLARAAQDLLERALRLAARRMVRMDVPVPAYLHPWTSPNKGDVETTTSTTSTTNGEGNRGRYGLPSRRSIVVLGLTWCSSCRRG